MYENNEIVKQWLKRYLFLSDDINSLIMRAEALRERATSPRTPIIDGLPHSTSKDIDRIGGLIALCDSIEAEAREKIALLNNIYHEIDTAIKKNKGSGQC